METSQDSELEKPPAELFTLIYSSVSTVQSLHSLIKSSPILYKIFFASKTKILWDILKQQIHPEVLGDALAVAESMFLFEEEYLEDDGPESVVVGFLEAYRGELKEEMTSERIDPF